MKTVKLYLILILIITSIASCNAQYPKLDDGIYAEFITNKGNMLAKLYADKTPVTVANFISLAEGNNPIINKAFKGKKFYNGTIFHRVIDGFMIQGGDPKDDGSGDPGYKFNDEILPELKHDKPGVLAMANSGKNTNGSQFYITEKATPFLDGKYTVFGVLISGFNVQDSISNLKTDAANKPFSPVILKEVKIIRKGKEAKKFNAPKVFEKYFEDAKKQEAERLKKETEIKKTNLLKFNTQKQNAIKLPSGLSYIITQKGKDTPLSTNAKIMVDYAVFFEDGKLLETSDIDIAKINNVYDFKRDDAGGYKPIEASIAPNAKMIAGFKEGLSLLHPGDKATLFIPYHLAYGETGNRDIPPKTNLIFEIEVIDK